MLSQAPAPFPTEPHMLPSQPGPAPVTLPDPSPAAAYLPSSFFSPSCKQ